MKLYNLFSIYLVTVLYTAFAKNAHQINKRESEVKSNSKKVETSDECKYINSLIGEDESFNCCECDTYKRTITCENGHIVKLELREYTFRKPIPESIGNLTELRELDLHDDYFFGTIPDFLGKLTKLEYL
ncbi:hypothetical protein PIROE2DRAFT_9447 [Piromyces sp. E2]|nr:hypothetical protein PIROE2DRAFT_9447 [Piromyces sp. E2]|eukprot:OUM63916.1 hypothetical protein PIROE2DRAFT_9447 [Piromyces sp. E2]